VRTKIEHLLCRDGHRWPDLITVAIGQLARNGVAAVTPSGAVGGGVDLLRRLRLESFHNPGLTDVVNEFFPQPERRRDFQPEPGCSDPTFIGSTTDAGALAAQLLDTALDRLGSGRMQVAGSGEAQFVPWQRSLCIVRTHPDQNAGSARTHLGIAEDHRLPDARGAYEIRLDPNALEQMRSDVAEEAVQEKLAEGARETGGLLLGQFDDASGVVWVTEATAPPPGSSGNPAGFELDPRAVRADVHEQRRRTSGILGFVGVWHSHPNSSAWPSERDIQTMEGLSAETGPHRALLLILGPSTPGAADQGGAEAWLPEMYAEVFTS
jgi:integrative and conjugative element protein (TIGR02256 family)